MVPEECQKHCQEHPDCKYFTFNKKDRLCWLKKNLQYKDIGSFPNAISGRKFCQVCKLWNTFSFLPMLDQSYGRVCVYLSNVSAKFIGAVGLNHVTLNRLKVHRMPINYNI